MNSVVIELIAVKNLYLSVSGSLSPPVRHEKFLLLTPLKKPLSQHSSVLHFRSMPRLTLAFSVPFRLIVPNMSATNWTKCHRHVIGSPGFSSVCITSLKNLGVDLSKTASDMFADFNSTFEVCK